MEPTEPTTRKIPQWPELVSLIGAFLLVLLIASLSYQGWRAYGRQSEELAINREVVRSTNTLLSSLKDAETSQRGFLLTGRDRYLEPYRRAVTSISSELNALAVVIAVRSSDQAQRFETLKPLVNEKVGELQRTIELRRSQGPEAALAIVLTDRGDILMEQIRQECAQIQRAGDARLAYFSKEARSSINDIESISTVGSVVLFGLLTISTIAIQKGTGRRQQLIQELQKSETQTKNARDQLQTTLRSIGDAVITTDAAGRVTFLNTVGESLTGWPRDEAVGRRLEEIFVISNEETRTSVENPVTRALREGRIVGLANHTVLRGKNGNDIPIEDSAAPIRDENQGVLGAVLVFRDITERRKAERARIRSEQRLELALNAGRIGVWDWDVIRDQIEWSDLVYDIHGVERGKFPGRVEDFARLIHPEDRDRINAAISGALRKDDHYDAEFRVIHPDGKIVWVATTALVFRDEHGTPTRMLGATTDITERMQAESHLLQQWHTFDTALSNTPDFTYIFDLEGRFTYVNRALLSLWQRSLEDARGKNFFELGYPTDLAERLQRQIRQVIDTKEPLRDQTPFTGPSGETRYYEYIFVPVFAADGQVEAVTGSTRDMTDRNMAEAALRVTEERLTLALEAGGGVGTWDWDIPNDRVYCNRQFATLFSVDPESAASGAPLSQFVAHIHPNDRGRVDETIRRALQTGGDISEEYRVVQADDSVRWVHVRGRCHLDAAGNPVRFPGVVFETTERRRAEEDLKRSNEELTRANRALEEFAYVASHDLQEPLRMVNTYSQLLLRRFGANTDEEMLQFASFIRTGVQRMETLIRDLLNYSRATHDLTEVPSFKIELDEALDRALTLVETRIREVEAEVTFDPLPAAAGDLGQFVHVFQNILSNALKYRKPDVPARIHVSAKRGNAEWIVSVADNGIGFDQSHAERIFGLFKRLHREDQYAGTGLGLAICKRIIESYGGRIWAESKEGVGSTFFFALPVLDDD